MTDRPKIVDELKAGRLVERVSALYEHLKDQPLTHADSQDMTTLRDTAVALAALIEWGERMERERDALAEKLDPGTSPGLVARIIMASTENKLKEPRP